MSESRALETRSYKLSKRIQEELKGHSVKRVEVDSIVTSDDADETVVAGGIKASLDEEVAIAIAS